MSVTSDDVVISKERYRELHEKENMYEKFRDISRAVINCERRIETDTNKLKELQEYFAELMLDAVGEITHEDEYNINFSDKFKEHNFK